MNADCYYEIGGEHTVCQDYALAINYDGNGGEIERGEVEDAADSVVVISDGCSGSPHTDLGARILARCAIDGFRTHVVFRHGSLIRKAYAIAIQLGLGRRCLDSTLISIRGSENGVTVCGDGYVIGCRLFGDKRFVDVIHVDFSDKPPYLSYNLDDYEFDCSSGGVKFDRYKLLDETDGYVLEPVDVMNVVPEKCVLHFLAPIHDGTGRSILEEYGFGLGELIDGRVTLNSVYDVVLVASDGLGTFTKVTERGKRQFLPCQQIVGSLLTRMKTFHGEFVVRAVKRLVKELARDGWVHADDLSVGGIFL